MTKTSTVYWLLEYVALPKVDELGRIVLNSELRKKFGLGEGSSIAVYTTDSLLLLKTA